MSYILDIDNHKTTFEQLTGKHVPMYAYNSNTVGLLPSLRTDTRKSTPVLTSMIPCSAYVLTGIGCIIAVVLVLVLTRKLWWSIGRRMMYIMLSVIVLSGVLYVLYTYGLNTCCTYFRICMGNLFM